MGQTIFSRMFFFLFLFLSESVWFSCAFWEFPPKCLIYINFWMSFSLRNLDTHFRHEKKKTMWISREKNTITKGHVINICTHDDLFSTSFLLRVLTRYLVFTLSPLNIETWENQTKTEQIKVRFSFPVCFWSSDNN